MNEEQKDLELRVLAEKLETNIEMFYQYGDSFVAEEITQLAQHYQEVNQGVPYHRQWDASHTLGR